MCTVLFVRSVELINLHVTMPICLVFLVPHPPLCSILLSNFVPNELLAAPVIIICIII